MSKYINKGGLIEIQLDQNKYNGYSVYCNYVYNVEKDKYLLSMWLKRTDVDDLFQIAAQNIDTQYITSDRRKIKENICKIVEQATIADYFAPYIERFQYTYKCFEYGNEHFEQERLGVK